MAPSRGNVESSNRSESSDYFSRRNFLAAATAGASFSMSGCVSSLGGSNSVKVGFVLPFSGTYSFLGKSIVNGFNLKLQQLGEEIDGTSVETVKKDTAADTNKGVSITREFLQSEDVDFLVGPVSSAVAMAMKPIVDKQGSAVWLNANAGSIDVVSKSCSKYHFRTAFNSWQTSAPMGSWVKENVADNVFLSYADYAAGKDHKKSFANTFTKAGGEIVGEVAAPLGTSDYSSYLQKIENSGADAVFSFFAGGDAVNYIKQFHEFGLDDKMTQTGAGFLLSADTLPAQGTAALGMYSLLHYSPTKQTDRNQKFVSNYKNAYDSTPNVYACQGYDSAQAVEKAVLKGGTDTNALVNALVGAELDSPRGYFKFNPKTHDPIHDMEVREVVKSGDAVQNKVVDTIKKVEGPSWGCDLS